MRLSGLDIAKSLVELMYVSDPSWLYTIRLGETPARPACQPCLGLRPSAIYNFGIVH